MERQPVVSQTQLASSVTGGWFSPFIGAGGRGGRAQVPHGDPRRLELVVRGLRQGVPHGGDAPNPALKHDEV